MPIRPSSPSLATISYGKRFPRSSSSATGRTSPSAKSRTSRRICSCSSVRSNCMRRGMLLPAPQRSRLVEVAPGAQANHEGAEPVGDLYPPVEPADSASAGRPTGQELDRIRRVDDAPGGETDPAGAALAEGRTPALASRERGRERRACGAEAQLCGAAAAQARGHGRPEAPNAETRRGGRRAGVLDQEAPPVHAGHHLGEDEVVARAALEAVAGREPGPPAADADRGRAPRGHGEI